MWKFKPDFVPTFTTTTKPDDMPTSQIVTFVRVLACDTKKEGFPGSLRHVHLRYY